MQRRIIPSLVLASLLSPLAGVAVAQQDVNVSNLTLKSTHIKTARTAVAMSTSHVNVFPEVTFSCPGSGACTVEVQTSFNHNLDVSKYMVIHAYMDETVMGPAVPLYVYSPMVGLMSNTWVTQVSPGTHRIRIIGRTHGGPASASNRTVIVRVYKP